MDNNVELIDGIYKYKYVSEINERNIIDRKHK